MISPPPKKMERALRDDMFGTYGREMNEWIPFR
jgi:hypothetical protein